MRLTLQQVYDAYAETFSKQPDELSCEEKQHAIWGALMHGHEIIGAGYEVRYANTEKRADE